MNASETQKWFYSLWIFPAWHILLFGSALFGIDLPVFQTLAHLIALSLPVGFVMISFDRIPTFLEKNRRDLSLSEFKKHSGGPIALALFVLLSVAKWFLFDDFRYESRMTGFPTYLFALNYASWFLLGFGLAAALPSGKKSLKYLTSVAIFIEFLFIFLTGVRQDLLLFLLLLFLIVLFVSPKLLTIKRLAIASASIIVVLMLMFFLRTQRVDSQVTFQNELTQLSSYITKSAERLYAEPIAFSKVTSMTPDQVEFMSSQNFFSSIKTSFTPRLLNEDKPELRPGNEFYQSYFLQSGQQSHISFPTGIFADTYRVWGKWSPLATFVFSGIAILFWWILFQSGIPAWLASFIFISELAVGNHIPFWLTGWLRLLILALILSFVVGIIQRTVKSIFYPQEYA